VCVNSVYVPLASEILKEKPIKICTVVGFPLGAVLPQVKAYEAEAALRQGATEIDMVLHIGALKNRDYVALHEDISDVALVAHNHDAICKVIIETALLSEEEKIIACQIIRVTGADFVKTSTGFIEGGATSADITLLRQIVGQGIGIKASGGIHDLAAAQHLIQAGANRIGTHTGVKIARQERGETEDKISTDYY
jgi:deoxyribose-phosphate aldolase